MQAWVKGRAPVWGAGRERLGPLGARCRKGADELSTAARPTTTSGVGSAVLQARP